MPVTGLCLLCNKNIAVFKKTFITSKSKIMKKQILSIAFGLAMILTTATVYAENKNSIFPPQEKAIKEFNKQFNNSILPVVYPSNGGFLLKAAADGHTITSAYNKNGNWIYTIKQYSSESLLTNIIDVVQKGYNTHGYYITTMKKIDQPGNGSVYLVNMQSSTSYKTLRVSNNQVEEVEFLQKA